MATIAVRQPLHHRVSWGSLFAGFFFGFGLWMLLLALGAGIGLAAFDPKDLSNWQGLGIGFGIWGVIAGIVSMFLAGWLAARLSGADERTTGVLHGAALWGFMLVAGLWIATMAVTRTAGAAASAVGTAAQAAGSAAQNPSVQQRAEQGAQDAQQQVQAQAQQLKEQVQQNKGEIAEKAATGGATGAWAFFLYGALTLAAACLGGGAGVPRGRRIIGAEERTEPTGPLTPQRV